MLDLNPLIEIVDNIILSLTQINSKLFGYAFRVFLIDQ